MIQNNDQLQGNVIPEVNPSVLSSGDNNNLAKVNSTPSVEIVKKKPSKILIGILSFLGVLVIAAVVAVSMTSKERVLAKTFFSDLLSDNFTTAYSQFSDELKEIQTTSVFESQIKSLGLTSDCKLSISGLKVSTSEKYGSVKAISGELKCLKKIFNVGLIYSKEGKLLGYSIK